MILMELLLAALGFMLVYVGLLQCMVSTTRSGNVGGILLMILGVAVVSGPVRTWVGVW